MGLFEPSNDLTNMVLILFLGAACFGLRDGVFPFNVATKEFGKVVSMSVECLKVVPKMEDLQ